MKRTRKKNKSKNKKVNTAKKSKDNQFVVKRKTWF